MLVNARVAGEGDGGEKLLDGLILLPLNRFLVGFHFLEPKVVLETHAHGFVQRELECLIAGGMGGNAPKEGIQSGAGVRRLRRRCGASQGKQCCAHSGQRNMILGSIHYHHYFRGTSRSPSYKMRKMGAGIHANPWYPPVSAIKMCNCRYLNHCPFFHHQIVVQDRRGEMLGV